MKIVQGLPGVNCNPSDSVCAFLVWGEENITDNRVLWDRITQPGGVPMTNTQKIFPQEWESL